MCGLGQATETFHDCFLICNMRRVGRPKAFKVYSNSEVPGCFIIWGEEHRKKMVVKTSGILLLVVFEDSKGELSL